MSSRDSLVRGNEASRDLKRSDGEYASKTDSKKNSESVIGSSKSEFSSNEESRIRISELDAELKSLHLENLQGEVLDRRLSEILP
ncbi:MAG TPA: hypothetical protein PKA63_14680, partial [Oligoflexia bacterium]|nr:hypothetical protein [Oligoflexia bacterium]HMP49911.1 hypothetical protein [Oligoflexia bacterium]